MNYSHIRGFNYQPSYGSTSFENWLFFDADKIELEFRRGKQFFPKMNAVRLWLSWDAFVRNPGRFGSNFEKALKICDMLKLMVVPVLFNRWHNCFLDCGGIYADHFMPGWSWIQMQEQFQPYLEAIVGGHKEDERILLWDICNEPFSYLKPVEELKELESNEYAWIEGLYHFCKKDIGVKAPACFSIHNMHGLPGLVRIEPISDVLLIHPYFSENQSNIEEKMVYTKYLDDLVEFAGKSGKEMLVTETCWGSNDDQWHVDNIAYTLTELKKRNLGWLVHALHHSLVADLHRPEYGPVHLPGNLAFIEADGSLRKGHEIFNEF